MILSNQIVHYDGIQYEAWQGLNTGLHAASELANVFLSVFDLHVVSMLDKVCKFYARFIDDGCLCIDMSTTDDISIFSILKSWNRHIQTDPVTSSCTQHFLDVQLTLKWQDGDVPAEVDYQFYPGSPSTFTTTSLQIATIRLRYTGLFCTQKLHDSCEQTSDPKHLTSTVGLLLAACLVVVGIRKARFGQSCTGIRLLTK